MQTPGNEKLRTIVGIVIIAAVAVVLLVSGPPWDNAATATAFYSALGLLAVTMTATALNAGKVDPSASHRVFVAGTGYASVVFAGAAIFYIFVENSGSAPIVAHSTSAGISLNLVAFATTGILMLASTVLRRTELTERSLWNRRPTIPLIAFLCVCVFVLAMYLSRLELDATLFVLAGTGLGVTAIVTYVVAGALTIRSRLEPSWYDPNRMAIAFLLLAAASLTHTWILAAPSSVWIVSMILMGMAFIFAVVGINYPFLTSIGLQRNTAYLASIAVTVLAILPFVLTHVIESLVGVETRVVSVGATAVIHFGSSILAGATAYSLYMLSKHRPTAYGEPAIVLLIAWSMGEAWIAATRLLPFYADIQESLIPYSVGSLVSAIALAVAARRTLKPRTTTRRKTPGWLYLFVAIFIVLVLAASEYIRLLLFESGTIVMGYPIGVALMLALSFVSLFYLLSFLAGLTAISGGKVSPEATGAATVSLWVIVVILKANFIDWTPGWWLAELFMLSATAAFPLVLLRFYLLLSKQREELAYRMSRYSGLMSAEIMKLHLSASDSLTSLSSDSSIREDKLDKLSHALADISRADDLVKHMEPLIAGAPFTPDKLETLDLVEAIDAGYRRLSAQTAGPSLPMQIDKKTGDCLIRANSLVADLFYSLLNGVTTRIGDAQSLVATIERTDQEPFMWRTRLTAMLGPEDAERKRELLTRYTEEGLSAAVEFAYARRIAVLLGGELVLEPAEPDRQMLMVAFNVYLQVANTT